MLAQLRHLLAQRLQLREPRDARVLGGFPGFRHLDVGAFATVHAHEVLVEPVQQRREQLVRVVLRAAAQVRVLACVPNSQ